MGLLSVDEKLAQYAKELGHSFKDYTLFRAALTHRSKSGINYERLEFLGDSVLNFTIAAELYRRFPKAKEGELTRMRARMVRKEEVAEVARTLNLGDHLHLGPGEKKSGGHQRESILADALEAVIAAIFLECGIEGASKCVLKWYEERLDAITNHISKKDAKTRLQELLQSKRLPLPEYTLAATKGDAHHPEFHVLCKVSLLDAVYEGIASTRRKAEQAAAEAVLKVLENGKINDT